MNLIRRLREFWWSRQRATDLAVLWPICKEKAISIDHARAAFAVHAFNDACWIEFYGEDGLKTVIGEMQ